MTGYLKTAAEHELEKEKLKGKNHELLKTMLAGAAGLGAGTGAGYLGIRGIDALMRHGGSQGIPPQHVANYIVPLATGGLGMALASWQAQQQEMLRRAKERAGE